MAKKKLIHFTENLTFPHLFQPKYQELVPGFRMKGRWNEEFFRNDHEITLELGCGKGEYTVALAERYVSRNFIGIDIKGARLWRGCKTVAEMNLENVAFIRTHVNNVELLFKPGEIAEIWITFPDPQPNYERKRLTAPVFLERYRKVLRPGGLIHLKTDDQPLFEFTMEILQAKGHKLHYFTDDLYSSGYSGDAGLVQTYYEKIWLDQGKKIFYLYFSV